MAHDASQEPALAGLRIFEVGHSPDDEVHRATDVNQYGIAQPGKPFPVNGPDKEHVDIAVGRVTA